MEIRRVSLIAPKPTVPLGASHYVVMLLWGLPLLGTILKQHGYEVRVFFEIVKPIDWEYVYSSQVIGFQTLACTAHRTFDFIHRIKAHQPGAVTVIGGTLPTALPEDMLQHCDFVVRQEGDESLPALLEALQNGRDLRTVAGLSYRLDEGEYVHTPDRPMVADIETIPDLSLVHGWKELDRWRLLLRGRIQMQVVQTSRGCPFACNFCIVPDMFGPHLYRTRSVEGLIAEIQEKLRQSDCRRFMFVDNYFGGNRPHAKALLHRILEEGIRFSCFAFCRLDIYQDPEFLRLLKQAGFDPLFIGFESFNDGTLQSFDKRQSARRILEAIQVIKDHGLRISGSFIIGSDEDTVEGIRTSMETAKRSGIDNINIFPMSVLPSRKAGLMPRRRLILLDYDFGSGNHVNIFPKNMKPSTLQQEYIRAYRRFNNPWRAFEAASQGHAWLGLERFMATLAHEKIIADIEERYLPYLYEIEQGYYDKNERLLEDRLPPQGIVAPGVILPPEEEPTLQPVPEEVGTLPAPRGADAWRGQTTPAAGDFFTFEEAIRAHTLARALRKCYGNSPLCDEKVPR